MQKASKKRIALISISVCLLIAIGICVYNRNYRLYPCGAELSPGGTTFVQMYEIGRTFIPGDTDVQVWINGEPMFVFSNFADIMCRLEAPEITWEGEDSFIISSEGDDGVLYFEITKNVENIYELRTWAYRHVNLSEYADIEISPEIISKSMVYLGQEF